MIPTKNRLRYAAGYIGLGMTDEASAELDLIQGEERDGDAARLLRFEITVLRRAAYIERKGTELLRIWREMGREAA